jgi:hypothetical protein
MITMDTATKIANAMAHEVRNGSQGGTYSLTRRPVPTDGYVVGGVVPSLINPTWEQVADFVSECPSDYVGYWYDTDGSLYVDAVEITTSERYARRLCALRSEIAYYDISTDSEVRV